MAISLPRDCFDTWRAFQRAESRLNAKWQDRCPVFASIALGFIADQAEIRRRTEEERRAPKWWEREDARD